MGKNCFTCKHKDIKMNDDLTLTDPKCKLGHNSLISKFWHENGHKTSIEIVGNLNCYEDPEHIKKLDNIINLLDKMNDIINKLL